MQIQPRINTCITARSMSPTNIPSIWTQMGYIPPRGSCHHGKTILHSGCPCQRFMAHPLKMASSFQCDGCGHHACFHDMENPKDDAVFKRLQDAEREIRQIQDGLGVRKRPKTAIEDGNSGQGITSASSCISVGGSGSRRATKKATGTRSTRQQNRTQLELDELERVLELSDE
ncbi:uncharacterized protein PV09_01477 [Verruconis gallopava]|uniref:Uncharacterized protein n=1 Tax=Verruconis gallopava TaxID=253628 RepID=A0A0D1Z3K7_9PEZI|nr:uncharacterized protein PV09_01477 [Verruconis gallopava]KIW07512.1 hypothetical protein PV09_01477 [Verruconis gallopava]